MGYRVTDITNRLNLRCNYIFRPSRNITSHNSSPRYRKHKGQYAFVKNSYTTCKKKAVKYRFRTPAKKGSCNTSGYAFCEKHKNCINVFSEEYINFATKVLGYSIKSFTKFSFWNAPSKKKGRSRHF